MKILREIERKKTPDFNQVFECHAVHGYPKISLSPP
jgi:hypothetical protein